MENQEAPQSKENLEVNTLIDSVGAKELAEMQDDPSIDITKESKENGIAQKMLDILPKGKYDINNCTFALNLFTIPGTNKRNVYISMRYPWETKNKNFFVGNIREDIGESHGINFDESLKLDQDQMNFIEEKFNELKNKKATEIETNSNTEKTPETKNSEVLTPEENALFDVIKETTQYGVNLCFAAIERNNLLKKALSSLISQWINDETFTVNSPKTTAFTVGTTDKYLFTIPGTNLKNKKTYDDYEDLVETWLCPKK